MAYDSEGMEYNECPSCHKLILPHQTVTIMHFPNYTSEKWHSECARPYWGKHMDDLLLNLQRRRYGL